MERKIIDLLVEIQEILDIYFEMDAAVFSDDSSSTKVLLALVDRYGKSYNILNTKIEEFRDALETGNISVRNGAIWTKDDEYEKFNMIFDIWPVNVYR